MVAPAIVAAGIAAISSIFGGRSAKKQAERQNRINARNSGVDLKKLRRDAVANGFNPLTVLQSVGGSYERPEMVASLGSAAFISQAIADAGNAFFTERRAEEDRKLAREIAFFKPETPAIPQSRAAYAPVGGSDAAMRATYNAAADTAAGIATPSGSFGPDPLYMPVTTSAGYQYSVPVAGADAEEIAAGFAMDQVGKSLPEMWIGANKMVYGYLPTLIWGADEGARKSAAIGKAAKSALDGWNRITSVPPSANYWPPAVERDTNARGELVISPGWGY